eukprot:411621_1
MEILAMGLDLVWQISAVVYRIGNNKRQSVGSWFHTKCKIQKTYSRHCKITKKLSGEIINTFLSVDGWQLRRGCELNVRSTRSNLMGVSWGLWLWMVNIALSSPFIEGINTLPRGDTASALAYDRDNDSILIMGGPFNKHQFVTFNMHNHLFTDKGQSYFTETQSSGGYPHFVQMDNILWTIHSDDQSFMNINIKTYEQTVLPITIPIAFKRQGCLVYTLDYLIIIGGIDDYQFPSSPTTQIYNLNTGDWASNTPDLQQGRTAHSCAVVDNILFAIGGITRQSTYLDTIEVFDMVLFDTGDAVSWEAFNDTLSAEQGGTCCAAYKHAIYVVGGYRDGQVDVIDTVAGTCNLQEQMAFTTSHSAAIIADDVLFVFGGYGVLPDGRQSLTNKYQYKVLGNTTDIPGIFGTTQVPSEQQHNAYVIWTVIMVLICACAVMFYVIKKRKRDRVLRERRERERQQMQRQIEMEKVKQKNQNVYVGDPIQPAPTMPVAEKLSYDVMKVKAMENMKQKDKVVTGGTGDDDEVILNQPTLSYSAMHCVICLDVLLDHEATKLVCGHKFHTHCIEEYNETNTECPLCRKTIAF